MSLIYKPVQAVLANKDGKKMWHMTLVKTGEVTGTDVLAEKMAVLSALSVGDTHNVIRNLLTVMREELLNGHTVRLDGLGTFTLRVRTRGKGVATADEVGPNQVVSIRCLFTPEFRREGSRVTRSLTHGVKFVHIDALNKKSASSNVPGGGNNSGGNKDDDLVDPNA